MNICITGALGHIGSAFIRNIKIPGVVEVHIVDNMSAQRYASLMDLPKRPKFVFHEMDVRNPIIESIILKCDVVIHLAAISDAQSSIYYPKLVKAVNIDALRQIVRFCSKHKAALFFPSTTSIYSAEGGILDENTGAEHIVPQTPYAQSKLDGERYIKTYAAKHPLRFLIFRIGTIFGYSVGMRYNTAVNKFIYQAISSRKISVWKTALHQKRPYCDLVDCIAALNFFIARDDFNKETYNIVTDSFTVSEIITAIKAYIPKIGVELVNSEIMNKLSYGVSNDKSTLKGLRYTGNLKRSIAGTIVHFQNVDYTVKKRHL